ncbi:MAG: class I SAM-dependent methyltransferase [Verrucomicrobiae bacterium]|nr:class I SAM-dependent methyltransferase [Verrucomicrobiae bacterium]
MNDRTFGEETARQWIQIIESRGNPVREQDLSPLLRSWVETASPKRLLEIGCGQGDCSARINLTNRSYVGIDPSPFLINRAKELYESEERRFMSGNAYKLPFSEREFDGVFSVMVWHLLSEVQTAAREMSRVMRPSGHFLMVTANPEARSEWAEFYINVNITGRCLEGDIQGEGKILDHDVLYLHPLDDIVSTLRFAGLEVGSIASFRKSQQGQGREYLIAIQGMRVR